MGKNRAPIIALFGPDGSGKSTIAGLLVKRFENIGIKTTLMHWRPGLLPYRSHGSKRNEDKFNHPHSTKIRGGIKGILIFFYIFIDFIVGYHFIIRPHLRKGIIVLYERYIYDILVDQKRYGLQVPQPIRKYFTHILPIPDFIILLDAPGDILQARKGELDCNEIERQRSMMNKCLSRFDNFSLVDVRINSPDQVADIIFRTVRQ